MVQSVGATLSAVGTASVRALRGSGIRGIWIEKLVILAYLWDLLLPFWRCHDESFLLFELRFSKLLGTLHAALTRAGRRRACWH